MKEATGELNMTVIVAISVGILIAFFFSFLWPMINQNFQKESQCKKAICNCKNAAENNYKCDCWVVNDNGNESEHFMCPFGG